MQRYAVVAVLLGLAGLSVIGRAIYLMTAEKEYWMTISSRFVRRNIVIEPTRGNILACNGEILASSIPEYKLYLDFMSWEKDDKRRDKDQARRDKMLEKPMIDSICTGLHDIFPDIDPDKLAEHLKAGRKAKSHYWPLYDKRITYIEYRRVRKLPWFNQSNVMSGLTPEEIKTRKNPYGRLACRTIGDLYKGKDSARTGLELSMDSILRGHPGLAHRQKVFNRFLQIVDRPAIDGCDIVTTLDVNMQDICEKALNDKLTEIGANSGVCILMEVATGDIKAMTSLTRLSDGTYSEINADAVKNLYEPGSVFKPMSFLVGMDDGYIHMNDTWDVGNGIREMYGRKMKDANWRSGGSGLVTVPQILQKSLNVGVSSLIDKYYHDNPKKFVEGIYRIGVNEDLKLPIPGYARPRIRMPKDDGSNWSKTALPWMSIGYETQIPPITTINFYNGIANNGKLLRPRLVKAIKRGDEIVKEYPVVVLREHMAKPEAVKNIQDCLESVVSLGLGKKAGSKMFHTSGKTGTAQIWTKSGFASQYLVSFAGYFPSEKPQYSCIVCIQKAAPASGGGMCAPVFKQVAESVMAQRFTDDYSSVKDTLHCLNPIVGNGNLNATEAVLDELNIKYTSNIDNDERALTWGRCNTSPVRLTLTPVADDVKNVVPDVRGYGLRDAIYRLEKLGLRVKIQGIGLVTKQNMEPGHVFEKGNTITLTLGNTANIPQPKKDVAPADTTAKAEKKMADTLSIPAAKAKAESSAARTTEKVKSKEPATKKKTDEKKTTDKKPEKAKATAESVKKTTKSSKPNADSKKSDSKKPSAKKADKAAATSKNKKKTKE